MKRVNLFIPNPIREELERVSKARDVSLSELIRRAIEEYLDRARAAEGPGQPKPD